MSNFLQSLLHPFVLSILAFTLIFLFKWWSSSTKKNSPPLPLKLPIVGNLHQLGSQPHHSLRSLAQRHGPLMLLYFGSVPILVALFTDAAHEIMKTRDLIFANRHKSSMFEKLLNNYKDVAAAPYGE
jgi:hypothetical protein